MLHLFSCPFSLLLHSSNSLISNPQSMLSTSTLILPRQTVFVFACCFRPEINAFNIKFDFAETVFVFACCFRLAMLSNCIAAARSARIATSYSFWSSTSWTYVTLQQLLDFEMFPSAIKGKECNENDIKKIPLKVLLVLIGKKLFLLAASLIQTCSDFFHKPTYRILENCKNCAKKSEMGPTILNKKL